MGVLACDGGGGRRGEAKPSKARTDMERGSLGEHQLTLFVYTGFLSVPPYFPLSR